MSFWKHKEVLVTGGAGFIGSHTVERLCQLGARVTACDKDPERASERLHHLSGAVETLVADLSVAANADRATRNKQIVIHLASKMAGLKYNKMHPAEMLTDNALLDLQTLKWCALNGVEGTLYCSGALVYDIDRPFPTLESALTDGPPNPDCEGSVWAKRIGEKAAGFYRNEQDLNVVTVRLANVFGPRDDVSPETAHLIGNIIRTVADGHAPEIHGDGSQSRSYLYVTDAVEALLAIIEAEAFGETVNVCGQQEVTVAEIIQTILEVMGSDLRPVFRSGPTGADRRVLDTQKLVRLTGFREIVPFREGIRRTVDWYLQEVHQESAGAPPRESSRSHDAPMGRMNR